MIRLYTVLALQCSSLLHTFEHQSGRLVCAEIVVLILIACKKEPLFFYECGCHVGGVPRSSLKGKETQKMMRGKEHKQPQNQTNHQTKTTTKNQNTTKGAKRKSATS